MPKILLTKWLLYYVGKDGKKGPSEGTELVWRMDATEFSQATSDRIGKFLQRESYWFLMGTICQYKSNCYKSVYFEDSPLNLHENIFKYKDQRSAVQVRIRSTSNKKACFFLLFKDWNLPHSYILRCGRYCSMRCSTWCFASIVRVLLV